MFVIFEINIFDFHDQIYFLKLNNSVASNCKNWKLSQESIESYKSHQSAD